VDCMGYGVCFFEKRSEEDCCCGCFLKGRCYSCSWSLAKWLKNCCCLPANRSWGETSSI
jgi:hypothetical protein